LGAERVGVRWGGLQFSPDSLKNALEIVVDLVVPKSDHSIAVLGQFIAPPRVSDRERIVLAAIQLDH